MRVPFYICLFYGLLLVVTVVGYPGCTSQIDVVGDTPVDVFRFNGSIVKSGESIALTINGAVNVEHSISVGGHGGDRYDPYEETSWSIEETPDALPAFLHVTFEPATLGPTEGATRMRVVATAPLVAGTYHVTIRTDQHLFDQPKRVPLVITVALPQDALTITLHPDSLIIAPGTTEAMTLRAAGILPGDQYRLAMTTPFGTPPHSQYIRISDTLLTPASDSSTFTVTLPASLSPQSVGANLTLTSIVTGKVYQVGWAYIIAGFVAHVPMYQHYTVAVRDTLDLPLSYSVSGPALFTPRLEAPQVTPPLDVTILQDVVSVSGQSEVPVNYRVVFHSAPALKSYDFLLTGDIAKGKRDTAMVTINVP